MGYWAHEDHADRIESVVRSDVDSLDLSKFKGIKISVSGRDISVEGAVEDAELRSDLLSQLASLETARDVHDHLETDSKE